MRELLFNFTEHKFFKNTIIVLIIINAVTLGLETSKTISDEFRNILILIDHTILSILVVEVSLRIIANGLKFFKDPWSIFDFTVTAIALLPFSEAFAVLRSFRIIRVLRIFSAIPKLRRIVNTIVRSIPGILSILMLMLVIFYIFAVIGTNLFADNFPKYFGDMGISMFTLFQMMSGGGWANHIARPIMEIHPYSWIFFVSFVLIATFILLNLIIVVLLGSMRTNYKRRRSTDPLDFNARKLRKQGMED